MGADDCEDYWGDDWNDAPFDCNAGTVYDRYIAGIKDIAFPFDDMVLEPDSEGWNSPHYSKEDMKKRKTPCLIVVPKDVHDGSYWCEFSRWVGADGIQKFYFGDHMEP